MCGACAAEFLGQPGCPRDPAELTDAQRELATAIKAYYVDHPTGGEYHVQLDDYNQDIDCEPERADTPDAETIARLWNPMTEAERMGALALAHDDYEHRFAYLGVVKEESGGSGGGTWVSRDYGFVIPRNV